MNELKIFNNSEFGEVRAMLIDEEPWFVGKDIATVLGYSNPQKAIRDHIDKKDRGVNETFTPSGTQKMLIINESGLYSLILSSKLPTAKKFKRWVTSEVLPTIRKTGSYNNNNTYELDTKQLSLIVAEVIKEIIPIITKSDLKIEDKQQKKRKRRSHEKFDTFPIEIKIAAEKMYYESKASHEKIAQFCCNNGYKISASTLGRHFKKESEES